MTPVREEKRRLSAPGNAQGNIKPSKDWQQYHLTSTFTHSTVDHSQLPSWISGTDPRHPLQLFSYLNVARSLDSAVHVNSAWPEDPCRVHPPLKVSTVVPVERFVK